MHTRIEKRITRHRALYLTRRTLLKAIHTAWNRIRTHKIITHQLWFLSPLSPFFFLVFISDFLYINDRLYLVATARKWSRNFGSQLLNKIIQCNDLFSFIDHLNLDCSQRNCIRISMLSTNRRKKGKRVWTFVHQVERYNYTFSLRSTILDRRPLIIFSVIWIYNNFYRATL